MQVGVWLVGWLVGGLFETCREDQGDALDIKLLDLPDDILIFIMELAGEYNRRNLRTVCRYGPSDSMRLCTGDVLIDLQCNFQAFQGSSVREDEGPHVDGAHTRSAAYTESPCHEVFAAVQGTEELEILGLLQQ